MSATQSWFGPAGSTSLARLGKIGPSWSLSVVATKRLRGRTDSSFSCISRITFLWLTRQPLDEPCLLDRLAAGLVIVGRPREPHQPASFGDRQTTGPAMTDVVSLLG